MLAGAILGLIPNAAAMAQTPGDDVVPNPQNRPVESYSLPPGPNRSTNDNGVQGPVDAVVPQARPPAAPPPATPARSPSPSPPPENNRPAAIPVPANRATGPAQQPVNQVQPGAEVTEEPSARETDLAPQNADEREQPVDPATDAALPSTQTVAEPVPEAATNHWLLLFLAALLLVLAVATFVWRARRASLQQVETLVSEPTESLPAEPIPQIAEPIQPAPTIALDFQPHAANATLINAVLRFELTLTNHGSDVLTGIKVNGAMVQAEHDGGADPGSIDLARLREIQYLEAGETEKIVSEFRVPLVSIRPILFGSQALFVPEVRISIEYTDGSGFQHFQTAAYLVGKEHQPPRPKMAPFRLDLGPRSFTPLGYRTLTIA